MGEALENIARQYGEPKFLRGPSAPGWIVSVLKLPDGETVSGAGADIPTARTSCLGEAAEYFSIQRRKDDHTFDAHDLRTGSVRKIDADRAVMSDPNDPQDLGTEGCASGETVEHAIRGALCETIERHVLADWWMGNIAAHKYPDGWLIDTGLAALLRRCRVDAQANVKTEIFSLGHFAGVNVAMALSSGAGSPFTISGFGASLDSSRAASKAISELFQMECGAALAGLAGRQEELATIQRRSERLSTDTSLFGRETEPDANSEPKAFNLQKIAGKIEAVDLSRDDIGVPTFRIVSPGLKRCRPLKYSSFAAPV